MSDPVALSIIAAVVTLGTAFLGAWGRRHPTDAAVSSPSSNAETA